MYVQMRQSPGSLPMQYVHHQRLIKNNQDLKHYFTIYQWAPLVAALKSGAPYKGGLSPHFLRFTKYLDIFPNRTKKQ